MSGEYRTYIPVFMPGNTRKWEQISGLATISDEGEINIKLHSAQAGLDLATALQEGKLVCVAFDTYAEDVSQIPEPPAVKLTLPGSSNG